MSVDYQKQFLLLGFLSYKNVVNLLPGPNLVGHTPALNGLTTPLYMPIKNIRLVTCTKINLQDYFREFLGLLFTRNNSSASYIFVCLLVSVLLLYTPSWFFLVNIGGNKLIREVILF